MSSTRIYNNRPPETGCSNLKTIYPLENAKANISFKEMNDSDWCHVNYMLK